MKFIYTAAGTWQQAEPAWKEWIKPPAEHMAEAVSNQFGEFMAGIGLSILQAAPDALIILGMIFCLGAIAGIGKCGKWAAASVSAAVVTEVIRMGVMGS